MEIKNLNTNSIFSVLGSKKSFLKKMNVEKIGLFGSFLKGKPKKNSDIDLLVKFKKVDFDNYFNLLFELEKIFNRKVDLIIERDLKPELNYVKSEVQYAQI
jgi:uncharacterized protein